MMIVIPRIIPGSATILSHREWAKKRVRRNGIIPRRRKIKEPPQMPKYGNLEEVLPQGGVVSLTTNTAIGRYIIKRGADKTLKGISQMLPHMEFTSRKDSGVRMRRVSWRINNRM
jgi:hypothetical protein